MTDLAAPFPWFGGKSRVAPLVWQRLGNVGNYVEPFVGSGAVLLGRPHEPQTETVNDIDGYIANFWRAVTYDPSATAHHADWPVNENDLHARHAWLAGQRDLLRGKLEGDPDYYDPKIAGWWVAGISSWIGSGYCSGVGPWAVRDGQLVQVGDTAGKGVNRQLPHLSDAGQGVNRLTVGVGDWFAALSARLRRVRVTCGDWSRIVGPSPTTKLGVTGVFLDPPYGTDTRADIYSHESRTVAGDVRDWCAQNGGNPLLRIALCGYQDEGHHALVDHGWTVTKWRPGGGYGAGKGNQGDNNRDRERIYFSPYCLAPPQASLFDEEDAQ